MDQYIRGKGLSLPQFIGFKMLLRLTQFHESEEFVREKKAPNATLISLPYFFCFLAPQAEKNIIFALEIFFPSISIAVYHCPPAK